MSEYNEEGFRAYCEANGLLQRDISRGLVNERIPASEEKEARESYYEYMKRRSHEEDAKERSDMRLPPRLSSIVREDTADMICKDALIWHRTEVLNDLIAFEDGDEKRWVHPNDVPYKRSLLHSINKVLEYFGVESEGTLQHRKQKDERHMVD